MPWPKPILDEFGLWPVWGLRGTPATVPAMTPHAAFAGEGVAPLEAEDSGPPWQVDSRDVPARQGATAQAAQAAHPMVAPVSRLTLPEAIPTRGLPGDAAPSVEMPLIDDFPMWAPDDADVAADAALWSIQRQTAVVPVRERPALDALDWEALAERVAGCRDCGLCEKRTQTVFGVGDRAADWLLVGEAPGQQEDLQGEPFVGQAGKLLDSMLRAVALKRGENVYIANVLKCRPPNNRDPEPQEVASCEPYLKRQVALLKPRVIVVMGRFAAQSILRTQASIASLRGRVHAYEGVPVIVTYHPAYLLRSLSDKSKAWTDWCLARATYESACTKNATDD